MSVHKLRDYPLLDALTKRRSRRFALGMEIASGPLAHKSRHSPMPLTEEEEGLLAFAACGITGYALLDLSFAPEDGGAIVARSIGRTIASGDAIQTVSLIVTNDEATYLIKRAQDFAPAEIPELIELARRQEFAEFYRRARVKIKTGRAAPPLKPLDNVNVNRWSLYAPGTSYFLPINELTFMYINGLLEIFNEHTGAFVVDERAGFRPAGLGRFARSRGGHLNDNARDGRVLTIQRLELMVTELVTVEQGMMLQNLALMAQALGLGGFPNFAEHEFNWFEALGFRMGKLPASRYLGTGRMVAALMRACGRDSPISYALGLECGGDAMIKPYCPPYYTTMNDAVCAVVETKFGKQGTFRGGVGLSLWRDPTAISKGIADISEAAVNATVAYCQYVYQRYGRFPATMPPCRTVLGFQSCHLDTEFYDHYYKPEALSESERAHMARWHGQQHA
jgi:hypothetical protein